MTLQRFLNGMDQKEMDIDEVEKNYLDALRYFVGKIIENELQSKVPSKEFVSAVTGLVFTLIMDHIPKELVAFCKHANRKVIQDEDLFLYTRKTNFAKHLHEFKAANPEEPKKQYQTKKKKSEVKSRNIDDFIVDDDSD